MTLLSDGFNNDWNVETRQELEWLRCLYGIDESITIPGLSTHERLNNFGNQN